MNKPEIEQLKTKIKELANDPKLKYETVYIEDTPTGNYEASYRAICGLDDLEDLVAEGNAGSNYTANDDTFPTEISFTNGRVVGIAFDGAKPYLTVGMAEQEANDEN